MNLNINRYSDFLQKRTIKTGYFSQSKNNIGFTSKKLQDCDYMPFGVDYGVLTPFYTKRAKTVQNLINDAKNDINISKDRDALVYRRVKIAIHDAKEFVSKNPQFEYDDICQDLILLLTEATDKELNNEISYSASIYYAHKKRDYFANLLKAHEDNLPYTDEIKREQKTEEEQSYFDELDKEDLKNTVHKCLSTLRPRVHSAIEIYFGLDGQGQKTFEQTADFFNLKRETTRQIIKNGLDNLAEDSDTREFLLSFY